MNSIVERALSRYVIDLERQHDYWKKQAEEARSERDEWRREADKYLAKYEEESRARDANALELERLARPASEAEKVLLLQNDKLIRAVVNLWKDYDEEEIKRFPPAVREAWEIGREHSE